QVQQHPLRSAKFAKLIEEQESHCGLRELVPRSKRAARARKSTDLPKASAQPGRTRSTASTCLEKRFADSLKSPRAVPIAGQPHEGKAMPQGRGCQFPPTGLDTCCRPPLARRDSPCGAASCNQCPAAFARGAR